MIPDSKKEEIREAADLVDVVSDYVKLKRSGRGYKGLCPFHDEKTPSFHVTPELGIYKCFGCGESGDVFNFVMEMEGVGFVEAMRTLADRFGVTLPDEADPELDREHHLHEGIYHALRYAGVFYHRQLMESDEAEKAREYLHGRGYDRKIITKFGLGYSPESGEKLYRAAIDSGLNEEYLHEAGLIKPSKRGEGFYDTFRGRLMFPIFNPSGKVIAFAGRILNSSKSAKYINSPQTRVYNKSEVLYGINFAKHEIRKAGEVILVEGYTDVITLDQKGIGNTVASSGTALTHGQIRILNRYGDTVVMIYDADSAGQAAMKRGINITLAGGMDVKLLELPENEDPDSFVRQFGKESFAELKEKESEDFITYIISKAKNEGQWDDPAKKKKVIDEALESIAHIPDAVARETFVQHLNGITKIGDRVLFEKLGKILAKVEEEKKKMRLREKRERERQRKESMSTDKRVDFSDPGHRHTKGFNRNLDKSDKDRKASTKQSGRKRPNYEKELIRLMLIYGDDMIDYIGSLCNEQQFDDSELRDFFANIIERYKADKEISVQYYSDREHPYPSLVGEVVLEEHTVSDRHPEKTGVRYKRDKHPYQTAKSALKALKIHYLERVQIELSHKIAKTDGEERKKIMKMMKEVGRQRTLLQKSTIDDLFPDPDSDQTGLVTEKTFSYTMKEDKK